MLFDQIFENSQKPAKIVELLATKNFFFITGVDTVGTLLKLFNCWIFFLLVFFVLAFADVTRDLMNTAHAMGKTQGEYAFLFTSSETWWDEEDEKNKVNTYNLIQ